MLKAMTNEVVDSLDPLAKFQFARVSCFTRAALLHRCTALNTKLTGFLPAHAIMSTDDI